jgi:hypothetical protein
LTSASFKHSANIVVTEHIFDVNRPLPTFQQCRKWYMFVVVVSEFILASLEVAIIHRRKHSITSPSLSRPRSNSLGI